MTVASTPQILNSTHASAMVRELTGRKCSRQNLEKLCRQGKLPKSCVSLKPLRLNVAELIQEYQEVIDPRQQVSISSRPKLVVDQAPESVPRVNEEVIPDYNESRARTEFEKANLLELERRQKEGLLLPTDQVEKAWANAITIAKTKLLAVPTRLRQRVPHLSLEEIAICEQLIRESLEELVAQGKDNDD